MTSHEGEDAAYKSVLDKLFASNEADAQASSESAESKTIAEARVLLAARSIARDAGSDEPDDDGDDDCGEEEIILNAASYRELQRVVRAVGGILSRIGDVLQHIEHEKLVLAEMQARADAISSKHRAKSKRSKAKRREVGP